MILYNGVTGSLGRYFADAAAQQGETAVALRSRLEDRAALRVELMQLTPTTDTVSLVQMAAMVSVPACERDPEAAHKTNVLDTLATVSDFLDWARLRKVQANVVYVSTGHVYGRSHDKLTEDAALGPRSVYAQTKLAAENGLRGIVPNLVIARVFGLVAPQQPPHYVLPSLIRRVRENNLTGVPGLDYTRDYLDARDVCRILVRLTGMHPPEPEIYNVCSGRPYTLRQIIDMIAWPHTVIPIAAPGRVVDSDYIVGDPSKIEAAVGEKTQKITLRQTIMEALRDSV